MRTILAVLGKISILGLILVAFAVGLAGTVYLSLRSPSVTVPDVTNKPFGEGERALEGAGLSIRERAKRYKSDVQPGVILDQFPRAGEVVKQGQTVAVIVSRAAKEGEAPPSDEIVEGEEEKAETASAAVHNENQNRPRRRANRNTNTNAAPSNANAGTGAQTAGGAATNAGTEANRGASTDASSSNSGRNANANDNRARNANARNANARNANTAAPRNSNAGRAPNANRRPD